MCETRDLELALISSHSFALAVFGNVHWVSCSCFVLADAVSVPMEMGLEEVSVSGELRLDQLLSEVPEDAWCPQSSLLNCLMCSSGGIASVCIYTGTLIQ